MMTIQIQFENAMTYDIMLICELLLCFYAFTRMPVASVQFLNVSLLSVNISLITLA